MFSKFFKHQPVAANTEEKVHLNVQSDLESSENNMVLRTEDLVKKYRQRTVVNHVSTKNRRKRKLFRPNPVRLALMPNKGRFQSVRTHATNVPSRPRRCESVGSFS